MFKNFEIERFPKAIYRRLANKLFRIILLISFILFFSLFIFINKKSKRSKMQHDKEMRQKCLDFINQAVDECLRYTTRKEQNRRFSQIRTDLPLKPLKMTLTTAVFHYNPGFKDEYVIKRVIFREDSPTQEDRISFMVNHKNMIKTLGTANGYFIDHNDEQQKIIWLFSEYLPVRLSHSLIKQNETLIRNILADTLEGLVYLHDKMQIIHLKIANIMGKIYGEKTIYKIIDFGYSRDLNIESKKVVEGGVYIKGKSYGTFPYKSTETVLANTHGKASDIWCIGAIAWFLCLDETPFYKNNREKDTELWRKFLNGSLKHKFLKTMSPEIKDFILLCMDRDFSKRPTAKQLLSHPFIKRKKLSKKMRKINYESESEVFYDHSTD
jgi:serine/threonine protein kinase